MQKDKWSLVSLCYSHALTILMNTASTAENFLSLGHIKLYLCRRYLYRKKRNNTNSLELIFIYIVKAPDKFAISCRPRFTSYPAFNLGLHR